VAAKARTTPLVFLVALVAALDTPTLALILVVQEQVVKEIMAALIPLRILLLLAVAAVLVL
jgi:hypothetical protein